MNCPTRDVVQRTFSQGASSPSMSKSRRKSRGTSGPCGGLVGGVSHQVLVPWGCTVAVISGPCAVPPVRHYDRKAPIAAVVLRPPLALRVLNPPLTMRVQPPVVLSADHVWDLCRLRPHFALLPARDSPVSGGKSKSRSRRSGPRGLRLHAAPTNAHPGVAVRGSGGRSGARGTARRLTRRCATCAVARS